MQGSSGWHGMGWGTSVLIMPGPAERRQGAQWPSELMCHRHGSPRHGSPPVPILACRYGTLTNGAVSQAYTAGCIY